MSEEEQDTATHIQMGNETLEISGAENNTTTTDTTTNDDASVLTTQTSQIINKCCICGAVKNCSPHLPNVFRNMEKIGALFDDYRIFLFYDNSSDNTLDILKNYKKQNPKFDFEEGTYHVSNVRTIRIAFARNKCLNYLREQCPDYEYFIMMDCDEVCSGNMDDEMLGRYLKRRDWDALTFNRRDYYDIWALSIKPFYLSCAHFGERGGQIMKKYIEDVLSKLKPGKILYCASAFNGFAIYRKKKFIQFTYSGELNMMFFPSDAIRQNINLLGGRFDYSNKEDCEHRSFHLAAAINNNAKIAISPEILFS